MHATILSSLVSLVQRLPLLRTIQLEGTKCFSGVLHEVLQLQYLNDPCMCAGNVVHVQGCIALVKALQRHSALKCVVLGGDEICIRQIVRSSDWTASGLPRVPQSVPVMTRNWAFVCSYLQRYSQNCLFVHCCLRQQSIATPTYLERSITLDLYPARFADRQTADELRQDVTRVQLHRLLCMAAHVGRFIRKVLPRDFRYKPDPLHALLLYVAGAAVCLTDSHTISLKRPRLQ